jgi:hypothetical protein
VIGAAHCALVCIVSILMSGHLIDYETIPNGICRSEARCASSEETKVGMAFDSECVVVNGITPDNQCARPVGQRCHAGASGLAVVISDHKRAEGFGRCLWDDLRLCQPPLIKGPVENVSLSVNSHPIGRSLPCIFESDYPKRVSVGDENALCFPNHDIRSQLALRRLASVSYLAEYQQGNGTIGKSYYRSNRFNWVFAELVDNAGYRVLTRVGTGLLCLAIGIALYLKRTAGKVARTIGIVFFFLGIVNVIVPFWLFPLYWLGELLR